MTGCLLAPGLQGDLVSACRRRQGELPPTKRTPFANLSCRGDVPAPAELLARWQAGAALHNQAHLQHLLEPCNPTGGKPPRYSLRIAIDRAIAAILDRAFAAAL